MSNDTIITVENLSKRYRLGQIGATSLRESAERFLHRLRGRNPEHAMAEIGTGEKYGGSGVSEYGGDGAEELWALRDVSFEVKRGEVLGVIGGNGAGKSTLLKILTRITEPTSGRAIMRGRVASLLEVGTGFHPELTGRENIYLNGAILGMKKMEIKNRFDEIVAFSEVGKFIDTPVKRYSSGMYVRLAFAVAAHLDPEILLVDEVLAVGDAGFQKKCLGKMKDIAGAGRTVLFVSHNMGAIEGLCERALFIKNGGVSFDGGKTDAIAAYLSESQSQSEFCLVDRKDRVGNGSVLINDISFEVLDRPNCGYWQPGEDCVVKFLYCMPQGEMVDHVDIGLSLEDLYGRKLFFANTIVAKSPVHLADETGVIYCRINRFPLSAGTYFLSYDVYSNGRLIDAISQAVSVSVESRDGVETWASWGGYATVCAEYEWMC